MNNGTMDIKKYYGRLTKLVPPPPGEAKPSPTFFFEVLQTENGETIVYNLKPIFYDAALKVGDSIVVTARQVAGRERSTITKANGFNFLEAKRKADNDRIIQSLRKGVNTNETIAE